MVDPAIGPTIIDAVAQQYKGNIGMRVVTWVVEGVIVFRLGGTIRHNVQLQLVLHGR